MNAVDAIVWNLEEVRRRSRLVWESIPAEYLDWKPDSEAMSIIEMIHHVLDSEHYYHLALLNRGSLSAYESPYENRNFADLHDALRFAEPYRSAFMDTVKSYSQEDLSTIKIDRSDVGYIRTLGDMLLRVAYHESVHTGQLLDYMRTAGVNRPRVWD
ncbi:putative damage-inducible protein DinB [Paenibacillus phyllosphaerae]|uniref:Putative damage-inducible protein DinB n=1 Tax=Paenibacillus phyllosphaerae TaxID=274593 RepID=A0A7W5B2M0_9BACL|nr:DinB family protein [Paenibacillus phyllosphaerae]MBB3112741.1 putative damage-inducible protein DinB [Paenibacillus phyllosphaerae]